MASTLRACPASQPMTAEVIAEMTRDPAIAARFAARLEDKQQRLAAAIAAGQRRGAVARHVDAADAARLVMLMIDGLVLRAATLGGRDLDAFIGSFRTLAETLLKPVTPVARKPRAAAAES